MISQLILTTLMALGIATGSLGSKANNESSNVLNTSQKTPNTKKATTLEQVYINETFTGAGGEYIYTAGNNNYKATKGYIGTTPLPNYNNQYLYINNTIYTLAVQTISTNKSNVQFFGVYEITNYYNSDLEFELNVYYTAETQYYYDAGWHVVSCPNNLSNYINLTLTNTINTSLGELYNTAYTTGQELAGNDFSNHTGTPTNITIEAKSGSIVLTPQERITLFYYSYAINNTNANYINAAPQNFEVYGTAAIPIITYEVVDIPNLMYTILTMPFSFISTAFNLTVFDGTPYALNFGNLFLTLIAVFILLWIIRKVFK